MIDSIVIREEKIVEFLEYYFIGEINGIKCEYWHFFVSLLVSKVKFKELIPCSNPRRL